MFPKTFRFDSPSEREREREREKPRKGGKGTKTHLTLKTLQKYTEGPRKEKEKKVFHKKDDKPKTVQKHAMLENFQSKRERE